MTIYGYAHHLTHPSGLGVDDEGNTEYGSLIAAGHGDKYTELYVPMPHGTMMRRAVRRMNAAGIFDIFTHTLPPHPQSRLGQFLATRCYADKSTAWNRQGTPSERLAALWADCPAWLLGTSTTEVLFGCDGSYEDAIQEVCRTNRIIAGSALGWVVPSIKLQTMTAEGTSDIQHPVLKCLDAMSPCYGVYGRSLDIWHPQIVDVLELAHESLVGPGRTIGGMWLSLGGPMLWGECDEANRGPMYPVRTEAARHALGCPDDINTTKYGQDLAPVIAARLGRIAVELVERLKPLCQDFYFHVYPIAPESLRTEPIAAGTVGVMQQLCERLCDVSGAKIHIVVSKASEVNATNASHPHALMRRFPNIEFIAGVGWASRFSTAGVARICEGYPSIEVGMDSRDDWAVLLEQAARFKRLLDLT